MAERAVGAGKLLAAALSESTSVTVVTYDEYLREKDSGRVQFQELGINEIFGYSPIGGLCRICGRQSCDKERSRALSISRGGRLVPAVSALTEMLTTHLQTFEFSVKTEERSIVLRAVSSDTVEEIKIKIESETGIPADEQRLMHGGRQLEDDKSLGYYNIGPGSTVFLNLRLRGGGGGTVFYINDPSLLDSRFDYDFTTERNDGRKYHRGGKRYYRPYGWERFGLNVLGKYSNNAWLGEDGIRTEETQGEWAVSYHALKYPEAADSIARGGFDSGMSERDMFGKGIYSAPSMKVAEHFAEPFTAEDGVTRKLVFQNRVSTKGLKIVPANTLGAFGEYWIQKNDRLIRPYGLCFKVVSDDAESTASIASTASTESTASTASGSSKCTLF